MNHGFMEIDIEDFIWDTLKKPGGRADLSARGLGLRGIVYRQLELPRYGRPDLVSIRVSKMVNESAVVNIGIFELKKGKVRPQDFTQVLRYGAFFRANWIEIKKYFKLENVRCWPLIDLVLVGNDFEDDVIRSAAFLTGSGPELLMYDFDLASGLMFKSLDVERMASVGSIPHGSLVPISTKEIAEECYPMIYKSPFGDSNKCDGANDTDLISISINPN